PGIAVVAGLWVGLALLALTFEVLLQVLLFPLAVHPIRHFRERHRHAREWLQGHYHVTPAEPGA
ncbi:MAG: hypothetical protein ACREFJ_03335, partial [Acetobacteraceae bacterium]